MRRSQFFIPFQKEPPKDAETLSHRFLVQAGYVQQLAAGIYSLLPLGVRVKQNIMTIMREEMARLGALEFELPNLQPANIWQASGRWESIGVEMFRLRDRNNRDMCLAMTHEEVFSLLAKEIRSYKDLPTLWYQISKKFRDEPRARGGLLRLREFTMKDSYSFALHQEDLDAAFISHEQAYHTIFQRCGLKVIAALADNGAMGGNASKEFVTVLDCGEDTLVIAPSGQAANQEAWPLKEGDEAPDGSGKVTLKRSLELGHIFKLGTKYAEAFGIDLQNYKGQQKPLLMGSYGIGVERLLAAIAETHCDAKGLVWPKSVTPFKVVLLELGNTQGKAEEIYKQLLANNIDVLYDDRDERAGVKFAEAELLGIPQQLVVSTRSLETNSVEVRNRTLENNSNPSPSFYKKLGELTWLYE